MFNLPSGWEIILVIIIVIFLFGGSKAKETVKNLGKNVYRAKKEIDDIKDLTQK